MEKKLITEMRFMMERLESTRMTDTELTSKRKKFIVEYKWREIDTITNEMISHIIQTMSDEDAANEIYEMITDISRYR